ncbi:hypothetical protein UPYG_G00182090 [Umbra pygmaea]|uniref:Interleukin-12 subunit beta n=1 Tax=Umbra pygmaea TaxID=75934 RepID=A0ABD0WQU5_UMBPY
MSRLLTIHQRDQQQFSITMTVVQFFIALLFVSLPKVHCDIFDNIYVVSATDSSVTMTCPVAFNGPLIWKHNNMDLDPNHTTYQAHNITLNYVLWFGEYSCWGGTENAGEPKKLGSVHLFEEDSDMTVSLLSCRAKSYDCIITCVWTGNDFKAVRLGLGSDCVSRFDGQKNCNWVYPTANLAGFHFNLSHSLSPYAEETAPLVVTAEAIISTSYVREIKRFYLRDIIQPDIPAVKCQLKDQNLNVKVEPPATWSTPRSFFPLEHEIAYILKDNGKEVLTKDLHIPKDVSRVRVHSRDPLVPSSWSQWSPWKNVTN